MSVSLVNLLLEMNSPSSPESVFMKVLAVAHPRAASLPLWQELLTCLTVRYADVSSFISQHPGHLEQVVASKDSDYERVIVAGGDGSFSEALNGNAKSERLVPMGLLPTGTGNDLARALELKADPPALAQAIVAQAPRRLDVGEIHFGQERRLFATSASLGFSAQVVSRAKELAGKVPRPFLYLVALLATTPGWSNFEAHLDGESTRLFNLNVANTRFYGGGMVAAPEANPQDGLLDFVIMDLTLGGVLKALPQTYLGDFKKVGGVRVKRLPGLAVDSSQVVAVQADGELVGQTPARFSVKPDYLPLIT